MIDIHAHLHDGAFDADRDEVVQRALDTGVTKIITIGTDSMESEKAVACAERYENVYASIGVHPHFFNEVIGREISNSKLQAPNKSQSSNSKIQDSGSFIECGMTSLREWMDELRAMVQSSKKVVAIGECGLDYFVREEQGRIRTADAPPAGGTTAVSEEQKALQKAGFLAQIELAQELNLPLIIHCRPSKGIMDAYEDLFSTLSHPISRIQYPVSILHCYMGDTEVTEKFLTLPSIYFSFTGNITYPVKKLLAGTKNDLTETVRLIPIERILAETDCPYLAPQTHRGKRNEPVFVTEVVGKIAEIKGIPRETGEKTITASAKMIFGI